MEKWKEIFPFSFVMCGFFFFFKYQILLSIKRGEIANDIAACEYTSSNGQMAFTFSLILIHTAFGKFLSVSQYASNLFHT